MAKKTETPAPTDNFGNELSVNTTPDASAKSVGADVKSESDARAEAVSPTLKQAKNESNAERLRNSRFCSYDDPDGPFIGNADEVVKRKQGIKVLPISMVTPSKGMEIRDGDDVYVVTEDMAGEISGDWLKVRSPSTGLALIR